MTWMRFGATKTTSMLRRSLIARSRASLNVLTTMAVDPSARDCLSMSGMTATAAAITTLITPDDDDQLDQREAGGVGSCRRLHIQLVRRRRARSSAPTVFLWHLFRTNYAIAEMVYVQ